MMPYSFTTADGITIDGIPDEIERGSPKFLKMLARARERRDAAKTQPQPTPATQQPALAPAAAAAPQPAQAQPQPAAPETTAGGLLGAAAQGAGPIAAGAALGAAMGAPFAAVGALPGAVLGGSMVAIGDPIVHIVNSALGTNFAAPGDAARALMVKLGVPEPDTAAERIVKSFSEGAAAGLSGAGLAGTAARAVAPAAAVMGESTVPARVLAQLAANPATQAVAGGMGAASGQVAAEMGASRPVQVAASLLGGGLGGMGAGALEQRLVGGAVPALNGAVPAAAATRPLAAREVETAAPSAVTPEAATVASVADEAMKPAAQTIADAPSPEAIASLKDVGALLKRIEKGGPEGEVAKARLVEVAQINPQAKQAADALGVELPVDVFSDNPQIRQLAGLTRSKIGTMESAQWDASVQAALKRADDVLEQFDARFIEGAPAAGRVSERVFQAQEGTRVDLRRQAQKLYDDVTSKVGLSTPVSMPNTEAYLSKVRSDLLNNPRRLRGKEDELIKMVEDAQAGKISYAALVREKTDLGAAFRRKETTYGGFDEAELKALEVALAKDQAQNVAAIAGPDAARDLRAANMLWTKERALGKRLVAAFGKELDGSIGPLLSESIGDAAKGGTKAFAKVLKTTPDDLRKEAVATAIASRYRSRSGDGNVFDFAKYRAEYPGLRANPEVYSQVVRELGPGSEETLRNLYVVSKYLTNARGAIKGTGASLQRVAEGFAPDTLATRIFGAATSIPAKLIVGSVPGVGGGMNSLATAANDIATRSMKNAADDALQAASKFLASDDFARMAMDSAANGGQAPRAALNRLARSAAWNDFRRAVGMQMTPEQSFHWLLNATRWQAVSEPGAEGGQRQ